MIENQKETPQEKPKSTPIVVVTAIVAHSTSFSVHASYMIENQKETPQNKTQINPHGKRHNHLLVKFVSKSISKKSSENRWSPWGV